VLGVDKGVAVIGIGNGIRLAWTSPREVHAPLGMTALLPGPIVLGRSIRGGLGLEDLFSGR
jgi:hypothetical protein